MTTRSKKIKDPRYDSLAKYLEKANANPEQKAILAECLSSSKLDHAENVTKFISTLAELDSPAIYAAMTLKSTLLQNRAGAKFSVFDIPFPGDQAILNIDLWLIGNDHSNESFAKAVFPETGISDEVISKIPTYCGAINDLFFCKVMARGVGEFVRLCQMNGVSEYALKSSPIVDDSKYLDDIFYRIPVAPEKLEKLVDSIKDKRLEIVAPIVRALVKDADVHCGNQNEGEFVQSLVNKLKDSGSIYHVAMSCVTQAMAAQNSLTPSISSKMYDFKYSDDQSTNIGFNRALGMKEPLSDSDIVNLIWSIKGGCPEIGQYVSPEARSKQAMSDLERKMAIIDIDLPAIQDARLIRDLQAADKKPAKKRKYDQDVALEG